MSAFITFRLLRFAKNIITPLEYGIQANCYAVAGMSLGKGKKMSKSKGPTMERKVLPVETDVNRLLKYCCGTNILKEGGQDVELKADSDYPEWLWSIRTGPVPPLEELDKNTKQYWKRIRKLAMRRNNKLKSLRKF